MKRLYANKKKEMRLLKAGFTKLKKQFVEATEDLQQAKARSVNDDAEYFQYCVIL